MTYANVHHHAAWVFSEPGDYFLTTTPRAFTIAGESLTGPPVVHHIQVGERVYPAGDPAYVEVTGQSSDPVPVGTTLDFAAEVDPALNAVEYRWSTPPLRSAPSVRRSGPTQGCTGAEGAGHQDLRRPAGEAVEQHPDGDDSRSGRRGAEHLRPELPAGRCRSSSPPP